MAKTLIRRASPATFSRREKGGRACFFASAEAFARALPFPLRGKVARKGRMRAARGAISREPGAAPGQSNRGRRRPRPSSVGLRPTPSPRGRRGDAPAFRTRRSLRPRAPLPPPGEGGPKGRMRAARGAISRERGAAPRQSSRGRRWPRPSSVGLRPTPSPGGRRGRRACFCIRRSLRPRASLPLRGKVARRAG